MHEWNPLWLTLKLACVTTLILLILGIPIAYSLYCSRSWAKPIFEAILGLPLVLPPTVLGFYMLLAFSPSYGLGKWLNDTLGIPLLFSFQGLCFASVIYSLPFMIYPIHSGLRNLPKAYDELAATMRKSRLTILSKILIPNIKPSILTGIILTFVHTIGEFGVVLMIGGNIPGKTRVASIAIYTHVEALQYDRAHQYALILVIFSFIVLVIIYTFLQKNLNIKPV